MGTSISYGKHGNKMGFSDRRRQKKMRKQWERQQAAEQDRVRYAMWRNSLEPKYRDVSTSQLEAELARHSRKVTIIPTIVFFVGAVVGFGVAMTLLPVEEHTFLMNVLLVGLISFLGGCVPGIFTSALLERPAVTSWIDEISGEWERRMELKERCGYESCRECLASASGKQH